jgi:hypothetical protein
VGFPHFAVSNSPQFISSADSGETQGQIGGINPTLPATMWAQRTIVSSGFIF